LADFGCEIRRAVGGEEIVVNNEALLGLQDERKPESVYSSGGNIFKEF
jgi:hypothetical protein